LEYKERIAEVAAGRNGTRVVAAAAVPVTVAIVMKGQLQGSKDQNRGGRDKEGW
jgi:hypothetical protein